MIEIDNDYRMHGKSSIKIQNMNLEPLNYGEDNVKVTLNHFISAAKFKPSTTYLLTFYIKMENVKALQHASMIGVFARLALTDNHQEIFPKSAFYTGSMPWAKQGFIFTTPATIGFDKSRKLQPHLWLCLWNATGTVWFDHIRIRPLDALENTDVSEH